MNHTDYRVFESSQMLGEAVAIEILMALHRAIQAGRKFLLGCPGGRSPMPVYQALAESLKNRPMDCSQLVIVMMDDYVVQNENQFAHVSKNAHYSCRRFAEKEILERINQNLPTEYHVQPKNSWIPNPSDPEEYEKRIEAAGRIDFFLLASGASDGHIAFNAPGTQQTDLTRIVELPKSTRMDNLKTFPEFKGLNEVPRYGVTVGVETIAKWSQRVVMLLIGESKKKAFRELMKSPKYNPEWPSSILWSCHQPSLYIDNDAHDSI